jgi:hypothetical protein
LRFNSHNPIEEFRKVYKPPSLSDFLLNKAKTIIRGSREIIHSYRPKKTNCSYFIPTFGFSLHPEDRPIICLIWTCRTFRNDLKTDDLIELGHAVKTLATIGCEAARLWEELLAGACSGERP